MRRCLNCMSEYQEKFENTCPYCGYISGTTINGDVCLRPGVILQGRYIVGTVKKARDNDLLYIGWDALFDRKVFIQEYFPRYCATRSAKADLTIYDSKKEKYLEGLALFCAQSRELIRLYKEKDIITYHSCFQENQTAYAVTEYREEQTLREWLEKEKPGEEDALALLRSAVRAMEKVHRIGVCHGMVDPDTFWVARDKSLILKDFGAWRYLSGEPGVVSYGKAGPETDVYGLARLFCQILTGKALEDGDNLEMDLMRGKVSLDREVVTALKHALSHETKSLYRFQEELGGRLEEQAVDHFHQNRSKRKEAKSSLSVPRWLYLAAGTGLAAVAVTVVLMYTGVIRFHIGSGASHVEENMVRVPNLINQDVDEAEKMLKELGLGMSRDKMVYSKEIPLNRISYQELKENTLVEKDTTLVVLISKGEEKGVIPSVKSLQREEAEELLKKAGFTNIRIEESQEEGVYNSILKISEKQEDNVVLDKEIVLTVCVNESNGQEDNSVQVEVPDLTGKRQAEAQELLEKDGFTISWAEEASDEIKGTVLRQDRKAGEKVNKGSYITVYISNGPEKKCMKNVQLMSEEEARREIEGLGLTVGAVTESYSDSIGLGKVISQSIDQDAEVTKGNSVDLVISKGKDPATQAKAPKQEKPKKKNEAPTAPPATTAPPPATTAPPPTTAEQSNADMQEKQTEETTIEKHPESLKEEDGQRSKVIQQGKTSQEAVGPSQEKDSKTETAEAIQTTAPTAAQTAPASTAALDAGNGEGNVSVSDNPPPEQP